MSRARQSTTTPARPIDLARVVMSPPQLAFVTPVGEEMIMTLSGGAESTWWVACLETFAPPAGTIPTVWAGPIIRPSGVEESRMMSGMCPRIFILSKASATWQVEKALRRTNKFSGISRLRIRKGE